MLKNLEQIFGIQKANWNSVLIRQLWHTLFEQIDRRKASVDHEEAWLILAGFFLRPGFGADGDEARIDQLWQVKTDGLFYPGKRIQLQEYILWRRISGGLSQARQQAILEPELPKLLSQKNPGPELIRLAGSLERIPQSVKQELADQFIKDVQDLAEKRQHCAPYLVALGLLLNRTPLYAGIEDVLAPEYVERAYRRALPLDWAEPELVETQTLFLRAARVTNRCSCRSPALSARKNCFQTGEIRRRAAEGRASPAFCPRRARRSSQPLRRIFATRSHSNDVESDYAASV